MKCLICNELRQEINKLTVIFLTSLIHTFLVVYGAGSVKC